MRKRIYSFDFLKIVATICIIAHHYQIYTKTMFSSGMNFLDGKFEFPYLVELFFVMSGYFMMPYIEKINAGMSFKQFFLPKYFRFLVPQALSVIVFAILDIVYEGLYLQEFFGRTVQVWGVIVAALGFSSGWGIPNPKMNGTIWYISVLLICYVIFYVIVFLSKKTKSSPYWMFSFVIFVAFSVSSNSIKMLFLDSGTARGLTAFFFGIILAKVVRGKEISNKTAIISLILFLMMLYVVLDWKKTYASTGLSYLYTFCLFPFLLVFLKSEFMQKIFYGKFWGVVGNISFEAYIWHFPLILAMLDADKKWRWAIDYHNRFYLYMLVICSYIVGTVCYYFVEIPSTKYFRDKIGV